MLIEKEDAIKAICEACYVYKYAGEEHHKDCKYYPCDDVEALKALPSAEQVTSKLKKSCGSLLKDDSDECKESGSKLESVEAEEYEDYEHATLVDIKAPLRESAEAVQGWIPCSERLPDVDVEVLTTTDWSDVLIAWLKKGGAWETEEYILDNDEILAWMPLPTPYKGGDDTTGESL